MNPVRFVFFVLPAFFLLGCTSLYYLPNQRLYPFYKAENPPPEDIYFSSADGTRLHAWFFPYDKSKCSKPEGAVLHYHGNAQNLSSHYRLLHWMTEECYDYYIFDYRAYGRSEGGKSASGILQDARSALKFFAKTVEEKNLPLIAYGQSIGGTLLLRSLQLEGPPKNLKAVIIESSFARYSKIGREKLSELWLTWPLQWLSYLLISDEASPGGRDFSALSTVPKVLIYSEHDPVVPISHGLELYRQLPEPKWFWSHPEPGHINSMFIASGKFRKQLMQWLDWLSSKD